MSGPEGEGGGEGGGHAEEHEAPSFWNLWGHKEQADAAQVAFHDAGDAFNGVNQAYGLTNTARTANSLARSAGQAEHLAQNAELMGNTQMAERFGARASAMEAFSEQRGALNAVMESPAMAVGGNLAGAALGGLTFAHGLGE